jgi:hypothetical protein
MQSPAVTGALDWTAAMAIDFDDKLDPDAHWAFERWRTANPRGFVVNSLSEAEGMIHFSNCLHLTFKATDSITLTGNAKLASDDAVDVLLEAASRGLRVKRCKTCQPTGKG